MIWIKSVFKFAYLPLITAQSGTVIHLAALLPKWRDPAIKTRFEITGIVK